MVKQWKDKPRHSKEYLEGLDKFLHDAFSYSAFSYSAVGNKIQCPCRKCAGSYWRDEREIRENLICQGFLEGYETSVFHGEDSSFVDCAEYDEDVESTEDDDISDLLRDFACGLDERGEFEDEGNLDQTNKDLDALRMLSDDYGQDLYPGCDKFSKLRFIVKLLHIKLLGGWSDKSFDLLLNLLNEAFPKGSALPKNYNEAKKTVKCLGLGYASIHACENDCILYWKDNADANSCPKCKTSRWKSINKSLFGKREHKVPNKVLRYFPIKRRFQRLFVCSRTAALTRWHDEERTKDGKLLMLHTAGSKSNARVAHDLGVKLGHPARRDEVFVETHKRKDGEIIPVAAERVATLQDILEVYPELKEKTIQEGDLYSVAFGKKEPRGRVRVLGKGPTPQVVGTPGTRSRIPTRLQLEIEAHRQTKEELKNLNQRVDNMQQRFDSMEKIVMSQGQHNMETSSQHASNSRHESPSSQGGIEVMYNPNQQDHHGEPTLRSLDNMQLGDDDYIIRKRVVKPRIPSRTTATCSREISIDQQDNLDGRDVILYAVLRADTPVAKATVASVDPNSLVGGEPLGVEFYEVVVNIVLKRDALLPRPYGDMQNMADAQYTSIAWPSNRMKFTKISTLSKSAGRALPM